MADPSDGLGRTEIEALADVGLTADRDEVDLLLRAAGIEHFWAGGDLAVAAGAVDQVAHLISGLGPPQARTPSRAVVMRFLTLGPKSRAFLVWAPSLAGFWYSASTLQIKRVSIDGPFDGLWVPLALYSLIFVVVGAITLALNWRTRFHRRSMWLLFGSVAMLTAALFVY